MIRLKDDLSNYEYKLFWTIYADNAEPKMENIKLIELLTNLKDVWEYEMYKRKSVFSKVLNKLAKAGIIQEAFYAIILKPFPFGFLQWRGRDLTQKRFH